MCDFITPTVLAVGALASSAAATGVSYVAQSQAANDQAKYQNEMYSQTANSAVNNYYSTIRQTQNADQQNVAATGVQAGQNSIAALQAQASARAASGESGATGNSTDILMSDYARAASGNMANLQTNLAWQRAQQHEQLLGAQAQAKSQIAGAAPAPVRLPSMLAAGLQIGSAAVNAGSMYYQMTPRTSSGFKIPTTQYSRADNLNMPLSEYNA